MGDGAFLVGCGDRTTLWDRDGRQKAQWRTSGMHVVWLNDIRVLEMDNQAPSLSRIVRLMTDGSVMRGDLIDGLQTSHPFIHDDGTVIFVRNGMLTMVQDLASVERQCIHRTMIQNDVMSTRVLPVTDGLVTTYSSDVRNGRGKYEDPIRNESGLVRIGW
jgi:hypothetical protein